MEYGSVGTTPRCPSPVRRLAGGTHGFSVNSGATGGYVVSYPLAAWLVGFLAENDER
jgi:biotin transporter BioY